MHISLDSALGRQRRLNSVGESVLQIAPNAAAAYSLRSLTGGDPKVVRVRRASDNGERDFTSSEITSGEMVSWVNRQVIKPLDIQALEADGRTGDFLIAKAAYSLRSLGTRQATLAATGDTVARANGKFVVQVRRSSDDALKSFTADEVTDGTLLAFTNADYAKYTSDFSAGDDSWGSFDDVNETGNIDGIGGLDNNLRLSMGSATNSQHRAFRSDILPLNQKINFSARVFIPSDNLQVDSIKIRDANGTIIIASTTPAQGEWVTVTANGVTPANAQLIINLQEGGADNFDGYGSDAIYLREITVTQVTSDGLVKTWYDQSVTTEAGDTATGHHAVQATPANQPLIVSAGALVADNGIDFDGSTSSRTLVAPSVTGFAGSISMFSTSVRDATGNTVSLSNSSSGGRYFAIQEGGSTSVANPRNITSITVSDSVSGTDRLTFALTTGATSTSVGALGSAVTTTTDDYGDDFSGTHINQIAIGVLRTASPTGYFDGRIREILVYNSDQTDNRGAIEANIGEAYSITGIPAYDDEVDGFVETWYDQSGNNRPLIQTTASEQPLIVEAGIFLNGVKSNKATSNDTMQNLQVSTDGTNANFGTDDWASGASSKLGAVYVGTVPTDSVVSPTARAVIWGGGRGVGTFQLGGVSLQVVKAGTDGWRIMNERQGLSPSTMENVTSLNTDADVVLYGTTDNREFTINVNGSGDTETASADLDVREGQALSLFGAYNGSDGSYYQRSAGGVCKECYLYAGDPVANIPALATSINSHYSIY